MKDVGLKLCDVFGLVDEFDLSLVSLHQTFQLIQASYHNNPYHNAAHAADVVQAACCLVAEKKVKPWLFLDLSFFERNERSEYSLLGLVDFCVFFFRKKF